MKIATFAGLSALLAVLAACATEPAKEPVHERNAKFLATLEPTGETRNCLQTRSIRSINPVTERTFIIRTGSNQYWVSEMRGRCSGATRRGTRLQYVSSTGSLCTNQIIRVVDNTGRFQTGGCSMGQFTRMRATDANAAPPKDMLPEEAPAEEAMEEPSES